MEASAEVYQKRFDLSFGDWLGKLALIAFSVV